MGIQKMGLEAFAIVGAPLNGDRDVILAAVENDSSALQFGSAAARNDKDIVLAAVKLRGEVLCWAAPELQADREIVLAAVEKDGKALQYAAEELQNDRAVVMQAIQKDGGEVLEFASQELRGDKDFLMAVEHVALEYPFSALEYASAELQADKELVLAALQGGDEGWRAFIHAGTSARADREIVFTALKLGGTELLQYASADLRADKDFILEAVQLPPPCPRPPFVPKQCTLHFEFFPKQCTLDFVAESLRSDRDVVLAAVATDVFSLWACAQELKEEIYQGAGVEPKEFFEDLSEDEQAAIQAFAQALRNPVIVNVLPRANPNANPRKVNMSTIGGQQLELEVEDNASTLGLRGPVATQIGAHPASLVFVLPSGQLCGHGQDAPLV